MQNNTSDNNDLDLVEVYQLLNSSKKLIIITTILLTLLASLYGLTRPDGEKKYSSSALIEIGSYISSSHIINIRNDGLLYFPNNNSSREMWNAIQKFDQLSVQVEAMETVLDDITSTFMIIPKSIPEENPSYINEILQKGSYLFEIKTSSLSSENSEKMINDVINYISKKHNNSYEKISNKVNLDYDKLTNSYLSEIKVVKRELDFINKNLLFLNEKIVVLKSSDEMQHINLKSEANELSYNANVLNDQLASLEEKLKANYILKNTYFHDSNFINTHLVGKIQTKDISMVSKSLLFISMSGFFLGLVLSFIFISFKITNKYN